MPEKKRSSEGSYEQKQERLRAHFDKENGDTYIIYTFPDAVILKDQRKGRDYEEQKRNKMQKGWQAIIRNRR